RNLPLGRLMDFFSMAYLISYPLALIGTLILSRQTLAWPLYISILLSALTVGVFVKYVLPKSLGGKLKDGNLSLIFFSSFSLIYILTNIFIYNFKNVVNVENIFSLIILLSSFTYLVKREGSLKIIPGI
ncbi:MAG TPA: hypothetical protein VKC89_03225, partial [Patescibacteria group bacterium]|nr:hypothetical protein [Patescibacteria group bacterium]